MKAYIQILIISMSLATLCAACEDENEIFKKEQYENIVYIVSNTDNIFEAEYELDGSNNPLSLPVSYGGTQKIQQNVEVTLKTERELFDYYNKIHFDLEKEKFAKLLSPAQYSVPDNTVTLSPDNDYDYGLMPVHIKTEVLDKLSPDSVYFISFGIETVSDGYNINPDKSRALYRIYKKNAYVSTKGTEYYSFKGYRGERYLTSATKRLFPMTKDKVRMFVGAELFNIKTVTEKEIQQKSVIVQVHSDNSLTIEPYDAEFMDVELLSPPADDETFLYTNTYDPETLTFQLYYRYRNYNESNGTWGDWTVIRERSMKNKTTEK